MAENNLYVHNLSQWVITTFKWFVEPNFHSQMIQSLTELDTSIATQNAFWELEPSSDSQNNPVTQ